MRIAMLFVVLFLSTETFAQNECGNLFFGASRPRVTSDTLAQIKKLIPAVANDYHYPYHLEEARVLSNLLSTFVPETVERRIELISEVYGTDFAGSINHAGSNADFTYDLIHEISTRGIWNKIYHGNLAVLQVLE